MTSVRGSVTEVNWLVQRLHELHVRAFELTGLEEFVQVLHAIRDEQQAHAARALRFTDVEGDLRLAQRDQPPEDAAPVRRVARHFREAERYVPGERGGHIS